MNRDEAKNILLLYRPGTADAADPQIAEALALAKQDRGTGALVGGTLRAAGGFARKIPANPAPAGLKEQIISEQAAREKIILRRRNVDAHGGGGGHRVALIALAPFWFPHRPD